MKSCLTGWLLQHTEICMWCARGYAAVFHCVRTFHHEACSHCLACTANKSWSSPVCTASQYCLSCSLKLASSPAHAVCAVGRSWPHHLSVLHVRATWPDHLHVLPLLQIGAGLIACLVVMYACTPAQLALWGWRIPFLLTAFFAPVALVLRMHMPEPHEFLASKQVWLLAGAS